MDRDLRTLRFCVDDKQWVTLTGVSNYVRPFLNFFTAGDGATLELIVVKTVLRPHSSVSSDRLSRLLRGSMVRHETCPTPSHIQEHTRSKHSRLRACTGERVKTALLY